MRTGSSGSKEDQPPDTSNLSSSMYFLSWLGSSSKPKVNKMIPLSRGCYILMYNRIAQLACGNCSFLALFRIRVGLAITSLKCAHLRI